MNNQDREKNYTASDDACGDHDEPIDTRPLRCTNGLVTRYWNG